MKIFDVSPAKTGTTSLWQAAALLGYKAAHGTMTLELGQDFLLRTLQGRYDYAILDRYDFLGQLLGFAYIQMDLAHPDAKFILLDRDEDAWVNATLRQLQKNFVRADLVVYRPIDLTMLTRLLNIGCVDCYDSSGLVPMYRRFRKNVQDHFADRPGKLLEMRIEDGWPPLCQFLGRDIPDVPFPHLNAAVPDS